MEKNKNKASVIMDLTSHDVEMTIRNQHVQNLRLGRVQRNEISSATASNSRIAMCRVLSLDPAARRHPDKKGLGSSGTLHGFTRQL